MKPFLPVGCLLFVLGCSPVRDAAPPEVPATSGSGGGGVATPEPGVPGPTPERRRPPPPAQADGDLFGGTYDTLASVPPSQARRMGPSAWVHAVPVPSQPGMYQVTLNNTGTGWQERFLLQVPQNAGSGLRPMLVAFHRYGVSFNDILNRTTFFQEAEARGWYCIAPMAATRVSFGSLPAQENVRVALDLLVDNYLIDRTRIYAVGFSMGGGTAASYASRHLDPRGVLFAAIANHTGSVSLTHTWFNEPDDDDADDNQPNFGDNLEVPDILEYWHSGTPAQTAFSYLRSSAIDLDTGTGEVMPGTDMSRNLSHLPVLNWVAAGDPLIYLYNQTTSFHQHLQPSHPATHLQIVPGTIHSWLTLDETEVCDWLAQQQLRLPPEAHTLADGDGPWFHFHVTQDAPGAFTPFHWKVDAVLNRLTLRDTANLMRLEVETADAGLDAGQPLFVDVATADGSGDVIVLRNVLSAPSTVLRDGVPVAVDYDAPTQRLTLTETHPAKHVWQVLP